MASDEESASAVVASIGAGVCSAEEREATRRIRAVGKTDSPFSWAGLLGFCGLVMLQMCGLKRALDAKKASN